MSKYKKMKIYTIQYAKPTAQLVCFNATASSNETIHPSMFSTHANTIAETQLCLCMSGTHMQGVVLI